MKICLSSNKLGPELITIKWSYTVTPIIRVTTYNPTCFKGKNWVFQVPEVDVRVFRTSSHGGVCRNFPPYSHDSTSSVDLWVQFVRNTIGIMIMVVTVSLL